jgi:hypothetical protein
VPQGFEVYARVLHPAQRETERGLESVRWSAVASWTGSTAHPLMQFHRLAKLSWHQFPTLVAAGELPVIRIGRSVRIPRQALERWIRDQTIEVGQRSEAFMGNAMKYHG